MVRRSTLKGRSEGEEDHHRPEEEAEAEVSLPEERDKGAEVLKEIAEVQREEETVEVQTRGKAVLERMAVQREIEVLKEVRETEVLESEAQ